MSTISNDDEKTDSQSIISTKYDLICIANIWWPILLLPTMTSLSGTAIDFWQVYFITLPHRWITLTIFLVESDSVKSHGKILGIMAATIVIGMVTLFTCTGDFLCLAVVDFAWNSWHFASQHAGIHSIYSQKSGRSQNRFSKWFIRGLVAYALIRTPSWFDFWSLRANWLPMLDFVMLSFAAALLILILFSIRKTNAICIIYLTSVVTLYSSMILACHFYFFRAVVALSTASATFHALEYLALFSMRVRPLQIHEKKSLPEYISTHWINYLLFFATLIGLLGFTLDSCDPIARQIWIGINLGAAMMHYTLDGLIWKKAAHKITSISKIRLQSKYVR